MAGSWAIGPLIAGAAALSVETVNADGTLLPGRTLSYSWVDSGCSATQALAKLGDLFIAHKGAISAVIGPGCSEACKVTNHLTGWRHIPQISFGFASPPS